MILDKLFSIKDELSILFNTPLPIKTSMRLGKFIKVVNEEFKLFNELRNNKIKELGQEDEKGNIVIKEDSEEYKQFVKEIEEALLENIEVDLPEISVEELQGIKLTTQQLLKLTEVGVIKDV